ncbi:Os01g0379601 [Oryza sativa Japonica Group]|uniref:Os01g0379601 protein n=1 Tax=Oryza sativa subsp. japonica TaxID=39947 RepID=A0A0P0V2N7_ORYSJ|nr:Os01g0379601 [Oryza sativa Japonica Group]
MVTEETATSVKASPAGGVSVRHAHTVAITMAASLELGVGAIVPAQRQPLTGWHSVDSVTSSLTGMASVRARDGFPVDDGSAQSGWRGRLPA